MKKYYTLTEIAKKVKVSRQALHKAMKKGRIKFALKVGRNYMFTNKDIERIERVVSSKISKILKNPKQALKKAVKKGKIKLSLKVGDKYIFNINDSKSKKISKKVNLKRERR